VPPPARPSVIRSAVRAPAAEEEEAEVAAGLDSISALLDAQVPGGLEGRDEAGDEAGLYSSSPDTRGSEADESMENIQSYLDSPANSSSAPSPSTSAPPPSTSAPPPSTSAPPPSTSPAKPTPRSHDSSMADIDDLLAGDSDEEISTSPPRSLSPRPRPPSPRPAPAPQGQKKPPPRRCSMCQKSFAKKDESGYKKHISEPHSFPCNLCSLSFTYIHGLEEHKSTEHPRDRGVGESFVCQYCQLKFTRLKPFHAHQSQEHNVLCTLCPLEFTNEIFLENHMLAKHDASEPPPPKKMKVDKGEVGKALQQAKQRLKEVGEKAKAAKKEGKSSKSKEKRKDPAKLPEDDTKCEVCQQRFFSFEAFERHIAHEHTLGCPFNKTCELIFVHKFYLDLHLFEGHRVGLRPCESLRPREEERHVVEAEEAGVEEVIGLEDLEVGEAAVAPPIKCHECDVEFSSEEELSSHIARHYTIDEPTTSRACAQCNMKFSTWDDLRRHEETHYDPTTPSPNKATKCSICDKSFSRKSEVEQHMRKRHPEAPRRSLLAPRRQAFPCTLCGKGFEVQAQLEEHAKLEHKHKCASCRKMYLLEADLNHHITRVHKKDLFGEDEPEERFPCTVCGAVFAGLQEYRLHQVEGHRKERCYVAECNAAFETREELGDHLRREHQVLETMEMDGGVAVHLTTARSQENLDIARWAGEWIGSSMATSHMVRVMAARTRSRRHLLFLDRRERERCSGAGTSRLYQLSNPGFLGGGGETDTAVIKHLIERVFLPNLEAADPELREIYARDDQCGFVYATCVLFPETFIHQHQVQGKTREEAEVAFMEMAVDAEERVNLTKEIQEAARRRMDAGDSGDELVDHSDLDDSD